MNPSPVFRKYGVVDTGAGYAVAFLSVYDELIAVSEHATPDSARAECLRLRQADRVAAFLKAATAAAHRPRFARPVRCFPPDEFA